MCLVLLPFLLKYFAIGWHSLVIGKCKQIFGSKVNCVDRRIPLIYNIIDRFSMFLFRVYVMNKYLCSISLLWLDVASYVTSFDQLQCFISSLHANTMLNCCLWRQLYLGQVKINTFERLHWSTYSVTRWLN